VRAKVTRIIKDSGVRLPGLGLASMAHIRIGQDVAPEYGGGKISNIEIDGQLICIYKVGPDGKPVRSFGKDTATGEDLEADGVAFPVHLVKSFLFTLHKPEPVALVDEKPQDPPPAKPVQQQGGQQRGR